MRERPGAQTAPKLRKKGLRKKGLRQKGLRKRGLRKKALCRQDLCREKSRRIVFTPAGFSPPRSLLVHAA